MPRPHPDFDVDEAPPWEEPSLQNGHSDGQPILGGPLTELGMARRLVAAGAGKFRYAPEIRAWFSWDGARWAEDVTGEVHRLAKLVVDSLHGEARFATDRREEASSRRG